MLKPPPAIEHWIIRNHFEEPKFHVFGWRSWSLIQKLGLSLSRLWRVSSWGLNGHHLPILHVVLHWILPQHQQTLAGAFNGKDLCVFWWLLVGRLVEFLGVLKILLWVKTYQPFEKPYPSELWKRGVVETLSKILKVRYMIHYSKIVGRNLHQQVTTVLLP